MTRLVRFLVRNWPLKLAALVLATVLYAGLVLSQGAERWVGQVPIVPVGQPTDAILVSSLGVVRSITYLAPPDVVGRVDRSTFVATADLSGVDPNGGPTFVPVRVEASDRRIRIIAVEPAQVQVRLDPLVERDVPVEVDAGAVPAGLEARPPEVSFDRVVARGPASAVRLVVAARASVAIDPSGLDVDRDVPLVPVDALGGPVRDVELDPSSVRVRITVLSDLETRSLPVNPVVTGTPARGFEVAAVRVDPLVVSVEGEPDALAGLARIDTQPVSVSGATGEVEQVVRLDLPARVAALGGATVRVTVELRPVAATRTISAGIVLVGAAPDRTYVLSTDRVLVTLGGSVAALDAIEARRFVVTVDVSGFGLGDYTLPVRAEPPPNVELVAASPASVEVAIVAPPSESPTPSP